MRLLNTSTTDDVLVRVVKLQNDLPTGWASSLCLDVCYLPDVDTALVPMAAGESMDFYYYFYSTPGNAVGYTRIGLRNEGDFSNSFTRQVWGVSEGAVGLNDLHGSTPLCFYPNPACGMVQWNGSQSDDLLMLFDACGRNVGRATHGEALHVDRFAPGVYTGRLLRDLQVVATARLVVQH